jgi:transposase
MDVSSRHSIAELQERQKQTNDAYLFRNLRIIILAKQGWTAPSIGMAMDLSRRVVQQRVYDYNEQGLSALEEQRGTPPRPLLTPDQEQVLAARIEAGPRLEDQVCSLRGKDFQRILQVEFGQRRSLPTIYNLLHKLNYSYLRPRPRHDLADPLQQQAFLAALPQQLEQIARAYPGKRLRIYFQDEARFGQQGTTTNVWAKTGSRPSAVRQTAYQYVWVMAAVCPETGHSDGLLAPRLDTRYINTFLSQFSQTVAPDEHAVMLWDGAGFHRGKELVMPANITAIQLPAYSPEFNPIENLWHYLKSHHWSNRAYPDAEALEQAVIEAWRISVMNTQLMQTVCSAKIYERAVIL